MTEATLLRVLLLASLALGPLGNRLLFSNRWPYETASHVAALACAAAGLCTGAPLLTIAWLAYTATSFGRFAYARRTSLLSLPTMSASVPFVFSNIAAVWLVGGANDLRLLGYGEHFSYYAALHGNVLGWIVVGSHAILAERDVPRRGIHLAAVWIGLLSFLLIAFGIDQLAALERIGVVGLSVTLPIAHLHVLVVSWRRSRAAFALGSISLAALAVTMVLAWRHELAVPPVLIGGVRDIVSVHGVLNALVVAPCLLAAVILIARHTGRHEDRRRMEDRAADRPA